MKHVWLVLVAAVAACGGESIAPGEVGGTYQLLTVNGTGLPSVLVPSATQCNYAAVAGSLEITGNFFTFYTGFGCAPETTVRSEAFNSGTFVRSGNTLTMDGEYGPIVMTVHSSSDLSLTAEGATWVYRR
jgi:hypothetical protein